MTKRFAIQCCITGREADMLIELFGLLKKLPEQPCGNMTAQDYEKIRNTTAYFNEKLDVLPDTEPDLKKQNRR